MTIGRDLFINGGNKFQMNLWKFDTSWIYTARSTRLPHLSFLEREVVTKSGVTDLLPS